jgi:plastocyanin
MRRMRTALLLLGAAAVLTAGGDRSPATADEDSNRKIAMRDDCDPDDPAWTPTGGCTLRGGDVDLAEFNGELVSPLSLSTIGHQAWRNDPSYLKIETGESVRVSNRGGRVHTFTEVANFGGGRVPPLNVGLAPAPECATAVNVPPGQRIELKQLAPGNHRFQCCIHPWMRALVKVQTEQEDD